MPYTVTAKLSADTGNTIKFGTDGGLYRAPGASAADLLTATYTTASLAAGGSEQGTVTLGWGYRILDVATSAPARVRLYTTTAARNADVARAVGTSPGYNAGVVMDVLTTNTATLNLAPEIIGHLRDGTGAAIPITVTATSAGTVTVTLTYLAGV
jgi:hypothetical protein